MNYRELQQAIKQLIEDGKLPANTKRNQKKEVLQALYDEAMATTPEAPEAPETTAIVPTTTTAMTTTTVAPAPAPTPATQQLPKELELVALIIAAIIVSGVAIGDYTRLIAAALTKVVTLYYEAITHDIAEVAHLYFKRRYWLRVTT